MVIKRLFQKIKSRVRQGKAFENMIRTALKRLSEDSKNNLWYQRIWDYQSFMRLNPNFRAIKQPADFMVSCNGKLHMIECKSSQARRFDARNLRPHQFASMKELREKGTFYWILILKRGDTRKEHRIFAYDYVSWLQLLLQIKRSVFKTADWNTVEVFAAREIFRRRGAWNLKPLFGLK